MEPDRTSQYHQKIIENKFLSILFFPTFALVTENLIISTYFELCKLLTLTILQENARSFA